MAKAKARTEERPARVPMTGNVDILVVGNKDKNYHYRWVTDDKKGRIQRFIAAWWDHVSFKDVDLALGAKDSTVGNDSPVQQRTGVHADGTPQYQYLMRIHNKYYKESQDVKQAAIDETERAKFQSDETKGQYGEVKVKTSRSK